MNRPKYVVFAMVDEPIGNKSTGGFATGGMIAAPVVHKIISRIGPMLDVLQLMKNNMKYVRNFGTIMALQQNRSLSLLKIISLESGREESRIKELEKFSIQRNNSLILDASILDSVKITGITQEFPQGTARIFIRRIERRSIRWCKVHSYGN